jgi:ornithine cyclodeaminase
MATDTGLTVRFLSQEVAIEAGVTDMPSCVETIEAVFELHDEGHTLMGGDGGLTHGQMLRWPAESADPKMPPAGPDRRFAAMPAYVGGEFYKVGLKWYGSNVENPAERGLPRSIHLIVLNDPDSGKPVGLLDGTLVSAMRTGAVAGVGARHVQGDRATSAAVIGAGVIGRTSTMALDAALDHLEQVDVFDLDLDKAQSFSEALTGELDATIEANESMEAAVTGADVVVVAAAGPTPPSIDPAWLEADSLVIPLGDLDMPLSAIDDDQIYVDDLNNVLEFIEHLDWQMPNALGAALESGERTRGDLRRLHELVNETTDADTTGRSLLFALGLPIEDVAWATVVLETAIDDDLGTELNLFQKPHWK